ncbi:uncharacterized protein LOC122538875 [Frieseomelitta varia]|uniref:uncharacterized protein LOC122538875 n=1 Tax=Frieseomelitta varia TaxID=561572 RepID=UPI001CB6A604|nr:uncharacterized protein LOC122538875 [Frieseomelitta varia]
MPLHYMRNPMYALCLLAAICVRQHIQNNRIEQRLTKAVSFQTPTSVLTKPNEASLKIATNSKKESHNRKINKREVKLDDASESLVHCVQDFVTRARKVADNIRSSIPVSKSAEYVDPLASSNILDSLLYLTSSIGIKWLA